MNRSFKILIVDDDAPTLDAYSHMLQSEGYDVLTAPSANDCLRIARQERPDLILLDVMLPDISGLEVSRQIKADPELASIFVIHISGVEISHDSQVEGLESGADLYLTKPVQYRKLLAQMQALLRIKSDVSSVILDQQKREIDSLERLSSPRASIASQIFSAPPLRRTAPDIFDNLVQLYANVLEMGLQQRAYKVEQNVAEKLHALVDQLGLLKAGPRDVVDIHRKAMKDKAAKANLLKAQAYVEEGRIRLVELMGHLVSYYRVRAIGADIGSFSNNKTERISAEEGDNE